MTTMISKKKNGIWKVLNHFLVRYLVKIQAGIISMKHKSKAPAVYREMRVNIPGLSALLFLRPKCKFTLSPSS